ncbi:N-acylglucosamine-6-phosphate 2-epimerase [Pelagirhabdus alkalitolerans]|uniref:Putative N-acetylmannosamine-6-phosphate 2-epimerase n=1 Tax=Pelagirhabdus alkalitolerans TaxID=1612202 RepID=A0A1G6GIZ1_9BACI|nr:N-acetylmannosamine-6-phosphate 2-epimerase [Pelagirhabdus alkalitolerans]SDB81977.1 N-acylglucosamine-6-phosphate 2-epimerase [Pelagirhabdus alkalitolerans]
MSFFNKIRGTFIVSCQALENEPLHSSEIMSKMAKAAQEGGADAIRANSVKDIKAIKQEIDLPIIGIIKRDYSDSNIFITATKRELDELFSAPVDMIALDATMRKRPRGESLEEMVEYVKKHKPEIELMADISTIEEGVRAEQIGFDCVSTTLIGYTDETVGKAVFDDEFDILKKMKEKLSVPIVAEGKLNSPELAKSALNYGADYVVVGSAITRPQLITARFKKSISE